MIKKIALAFILYTIAILFIGRNLTFIPTIGGNEKKESAPDLRQAVLEKFLKGENGSFSIYYKNLATGEEFGIDENKVQTAASLNKVPIVSYLYNQAQAGKQDLEDRITIQKDDIQDYGTGSIRYNGEGKAYSLKTLTKLALEQSDNTAAHVLGVRLGTDNIQKYVASLGLRATDMENNKTTAREMGTLLENIYQGKVAGKVLTSELLDFMKDTDFEDRLARDLPGEALVYHKAADGVGFVHDAGIIKGDKDAFILTILTSDITSVDEAKNTIGKIAKYIYEK